MAGHVASSLELLGIERPRLLLYESDPSVIYHFKNTLTYVDWIAPKNDTHRTMSDDSW